MSYHLIHLNILLKGSRPPSGAAANAARNASSNKSKKAKKKPHADDDDDGFIHDDDEAVGKRNIPYFAIHFIIVLQWRLSSDRLKAVNLFFLSIITHLSYRRNQIAIECSFNAVCTRKEREEIRPS